VTDVGLVVGDTAAGVMSAVGDGSQVGNQSQLHTAASAAIRFPAGQDCVDILAT
jgi:hypothetical protein